jgi:hypothetical protein
MSENINSREEVKSNWIGGEYYIQTCLLFLLDKKFKNNYFGLTFTENNEFINNTLDNCKIIIVPGWQDDIHINHILYPYKNKLYSYTYFKRNFENMKNLTSHKFNINTTPLYFYMIPLKIDSNDIFKSNIKGILMGKCISHNIKIIDRIINLLNLLDDNNEIYYLTIYTNMLRNELKSNDILIPVNIDSVFIIALAIQNYKFYRKFILRAKFY